MYGYAANSASASALSPVPSPPQPTNPAAAGHLAAAAHAAVQSGSSAHTTTAHWMSSVPQTLQGLSTPGSTPGNGLSPTAMGTGAALGSSGPFSSLSSLTGASGKGATKSASTGAGRRRSARGPAVAGLAEEAAGYGADGAGLIADGGGIGIDLYGLDLDYQGLALDEAGAGSILGAEAGTGIAGTAGLGSLEPPAGLGQGASASVGQAGALSTLSVPPSWATTVSTVTPLPSPNSGPVPGGWAAGGVPAAVGRDGRARIRGRGAPGRPARLAHSAGDRVSHRLTRHAVPKSANRSTTKEIVMPSPAPPRSGRPRRDRNPLALIAKPLLCAALAAAGRRLPVPIRTPAAPQIRSAVSVAAAAGRDRRAIRRKSIMDCDRGFRTGALRRHPSGHRVEAGTGRQLTGSAVSPGAITPRGGSRRSPARPAPFARRAPGRR